MVQTVDDTGTFSCLLLLTFFLVLLEISFFIQCHQAYLFGFVEVSQQLHIPLAIIPGIVFFIFVQCLIHFVFCLIAWLLTLGLCNVFPVKKKLSLSIGIWFLLLLTCLLANQIYFPNSKFADLTEFIFPNHKFAESLFLFLLSITVMISIQAIVGLSRGYPAKFSIVFSALLTTGLAVSYPGNRLLSIPATSEKPNVIIIGIDSLRPDFLSFFGHDHATPTFDRFLQQATVFTEAVTPLSRTFPSWTTILTGKHPKLIGVRSNLADQSHLDLSDSLPTVLRQHGYTTMFATDESRFSNIDQNFGFDRIIVPPMGLNDFLIGSLNDFPLSNLIVNTRLGKLLFPYSYANRGVAFTYSPSSFLNLLRDNLSKIRNGPLFLAVHFCLPHFPYLWDKQASSKLSVLQRYQASVLGADKQLSAFLSLLQEAGVLNHAIVVLVSDHGEAIELRGDRVTQPGLYVGSNKPTRFYPQSLEDEDFDQSAGHGTDVLGLVQYHSLLAFRSYGFPVETFRSISGTVSLEQIKPTLFSLLGLKATSTKKSLASYISDGSSRVESAHIFIESDFSPESMRTVYPQLDKVLLEGIQLYEVKPHTTRLVLKKDMEKMVIASKQYADLYGDWILALYPADQKFTKPILVNLRSGLWTDTLTSEFAKRSPAQKMLQALQNFYRGEIKPLAKEYSHP